MRRYRIATLSSCAMWLLAAACGSNGGPDPNDGEDRGNTEAELSAGAAGTGRGTPGGTAHGTSSSAADPIALPPSVSMAEAGTLYCGAELCQCNNGIDDDGDGTVDGFDVECTGGIDDDEATFATGIPGDNRDPKWQDCFFDGNSGAGDDRCRYPTECLTGELSLDDDACSVTQDCLDNCQPRTPNGCDCFGCCAVELPFGGQVNVTLGDSCSLAKIGDPEACAPCTPNPTCANECGECELCPGKTAAALPESCAPPADPGAPDPTDPPSDPGEPPPDPSEPPPDPTIDPPDFTCNGGSVCDESLGCPVGKFCSLGCCLVVLR
ncbi:MAG TPA: hypothetical protein VNN80_35165 [Polyangiaceae bacterium]|nr:hypothetical protein [Polyangiaceae bacterium]